MKTKYDWSKVPDWVNWIFTDRDGDVFGCDNKPISDSGFHGNPANDTWFYLDNEKRNDWMDSLEARPL